MKRLFVLVACAVVMAGCAMTFPKPPQPVRVAKVAAPVQLDGNGRPVERVPFRPGVSSVTVENLAKQQGCTGGQGAGLISAPGPVELYRMVCDSNKVFTARCEFRQCKQTSAMPEGGYAAPAPAPAPAPAAAPAPAPAVAAASPPPTGLQAPKLAVSWACGKCVKNDKVAAAITAAFEKEAAARGYTVSNTQTATMTIRKYREKSTQAGVAPGRDFINTQTAFEGKTVQITDASSKMSINMNALGATVASATFEKLFPSSK